MKTQHFVRDHKTTRGESRRFLGNFLFNFTRSARLMHAILRVFRSDELLLEEAMRSYIIALTSALETYYRDIYVYVLSQDKDALCRVLSGEKDKASLSDIHASLDAGLEFYDIAASTAAFQSLDQVDAFMSKLFDQRGYLETLEKYECEFAVPARGARARIKLPSSWRVDLATVFSKRHALVHDANKSFDLSPDDMQRLETVALLVPQLTAELLARKFNGKGTLRFAGLPALMILEDILSDNWYVVTDGSSGFYLQGFKDEVTGDASAGP